MISELNKRILTSIILLVFIFSFLKHSNEDYFLALFLIIGFICYFEWMLVNSDTLGGSNYFKNSSIHLFGFFYFLFVFPASAFYLRFGGMKSSMDYPDVNLNFFYLILIICIFLVIYPFIFQNNLEDPLIRELNLKTRKEKLLLELDNELASGVLDKNLHSQLSSEVNQMINIELKNLDDISPKIDPIEKLIKSKKNENKK